MNVLCIDGSNMMRLWILSLFLVVASCWSNNPPVSTQSPQLQNQHTNVLQIAPAPTAAPSLFDLHKRLSLDKANETCGYFEDGNWSCSTSEYCVWSAKAFQCCQSNTDCGAQTACLNKDQAYKTCWSTPTLCDWQTVQCKYSTDTACVAYLVSFYPNASSTYTNWQCGPTSYTAYGLVEAPSASTLLSTSDNSTTSVSAASSTSTDPPADDTDTKKTSKGTIAGAVVGSVLGVALIVAVAWFMLNRIKQKKKEQAYGDVPIMTGEVTEPLHR